MLFSIIPNYYMKKASSRYTSPCKCFCYSSYSLSLILPLNKYKLLLRQFLRKRFRYEIVVIQSEYSFVVFKYYLHGYYCTLTRDCQSDVLMYLIQDICAEDGAQLVRWTSALRRP